MKILRHPFWGSFFGGALLLLVSAAVTAILLYLNDPISLKNWQSATVKINSFIMAATLACLSLILLISFIINLTKKYAVFISAPMSFESDEEYKKFRDSCLEIKKLLHDECGYKKIYYAGEHIKSIKNFSANQHAAEDDLKALKSSKRLLLIHPARMNTSTIFEAGYAFRKKLPTVYFCKKTTDLPFLMQNLNDAFRYVRKYECKDIENAMHLIKMHKGKLFKKSA